MPLVNVCQSWASNPFYAWPFIFDRVTPLLQSEVLLLTQGVERGNPILLPYVESTVLTNAVAGLDSVDELAVVKFVLADYLHDGLLEQVHLFRDEFQRAKDIVCCPKFAKAIENDLFFLNRREMLPPYLWHCLLSLRLEPLGQYIANPIDREDLVVDGALRDSWHGLFLDLIWI